MVSAARRRIVFNSIKNAIKKGQEVEYWAMKMYEQLDAGVLTDEQVAELEQLIDEYYEQQEQPEIEETNEDAEDITDGE